MGMPDQNSSPEHVDIPTSISEATASAQKETNIEKGRQEKLQYELEQELEPKPEVSLDPVPGEDDLTDVDIEKLCREANDNVNCAEKALEQARADVRAAHDLREDSMKPIPLHVLNAKAKGIDKVENNRRQKLKEAMATLSLGLRRRKRAQNGLPEQTSRHPNHAAPRKT